MQRQIWYFLIFSQFTLTLTGQTTRHSASVYSTYRLPDVVQSPGSRMVLETVHFPTFGDECALELVTVGIGNGWGRISGMNVFGDREKAQRLEFNGSESYLVVGAFVFFERPAIVGDGTINCKIYSINPNNGGPLAIKGFSNSVKVSEVIPPDSLARATPFSFEAGVEVQLNEPLFFASIDFSNLYNAEDTLVILQTIPECGDGGDTWELFADGTTWTPISSSDSWEMNADFTISAVVDFNDPTSVDSYIAKSGLRIHPVYPNPVSGEVNLSYTIDESIQVLVQIFDQQGVEIKRLEPGLQQRGRHRLSVGTNQFSAGQYYYRITGGHNSITSRFQVVE